jgi:AraC family transcriptional regulator
VLGAGEYFGRAVRRWACGDLVVTLSDYPPRERQPWHAHVNPIVFVLVSGDHRDTLRGGEHTQPALGLVFHAEDEPHATEVGPRGMRGLNVEFPRGWLDGLERELSGRPRSRPLDAAASPALALRLLALSFRRGPAWEAEFEACAIEALGLGLGAPGRGHRVTPACVAAAEEVLREGSRDALGLRDVARRVGVHPIYLARAFRRHRGRSVGAFLRALRLADAARLILDEGRPIVEAAALAGFADQAHLTRRASAEIGLAPGRLRRHLLGA